MSFLAPPATAGDRAAVLPAALRPRAAEAPTASRLVWAAVVGTVTSLVLRPPPTVLVAALLLCAAASLAVVTLRPGALLALAMLGGLAVGGARLERLDHDPWAGRIGQTVAGRVVLERAPRGRPPLRRAEGRVLGPEGGPVLVRLAGGAEIDRGAVLEVRGRLTRPRPAQGGYDERRLLARRGIHAVLYVRTARVVGRRGGAWGALDAVRRRALVTYLAAGDDDAGRLLGSLAVGADEDLTPRTRDAFQAAGLAHLLAVSGQNIALLAALVGLAVWALGFGRVAAQSACILAIVGYVGVVGPSPSVVRAGVAGVLTAAAWLLSRPADRWHLYAVGALVLLAPNPYTLLDVGFQLSFAAVAAILLLAPRLQRRLEGVAMPDLVRAPVAVSVACTLATAPIGYVHFGRVGLVAAVPANVVAAPAAAPLLWIGVVSAALDPVAPRPARLVAAVGRAPALYLLATARLGARLDAWSRRHAVALGAAVVALAGLSAAVLGPRDPP